MDDRAPMTVAIAHDYLTQWAGAERLVLSLARAFPDAAIHTAFYDPDATFPAFAACDVRASPLNRVVPLRRNFRLAMPALAPLFATMRVDADVVICSSSGWAHGAAVRHRKLVYCHNPARWLYQADQYLAEASRPLKAAVRVLSPALRRWDRRAALSADRYVANSTAVRDRVERIYGIEAVVVPPPHSIDPAGAQEPCPGVQAPFFLCVTRLLAYKNVDAVIRAVQRRPGRRLVVVGRGPDAARLAALAGPEVTFRQAVPDDQLRWLYDRCTALVAAAYEDFGIAPLEAAAFGKPVAALRWGGYLDTVDEGETGLFFERPEPHLVAEALDSVVAHRWRRERIVAHAGGFSEDRFVQRMRAEVDRLR